MYEIQEIKNNYSSDKWDSCVKKYHGSFLQSWDWGVFKESQGRKIWRVIIFSTKKSKSFPFLIYKENLPGGFNWLYIPFLYVTDQDVLKVLLNFIKKKAKTEKSLFVYVDLSFEKIDEGIYFDFEYKKRVNASIQPLDTILLQIGSEEEMLSKMHKKTRYNIRLAEKKGVKVKFSKSIHDIKAFFELIRKTEKRQGISSHTFDYYKKLLELKNFYLINAYVDDVLIASNIITIFGDRCTYLHGASDYEKRTFMATFLLQWKSILFAKKQGCQTYDFWGIKGKSANTKNWEGITKFKQGFVMNTENKSQVHYAGLYIYIARPVYYFLYRFFRPIRKILRFVR